MISILRLSIIIAALALSGCVKNEFIIEFELADDVTANISASYHATDKTGGIQIEAVAPVTNGKGTLKGITRFPTIVYLSAKSSKQATVVYVERGDKIKVTGSGMKMESWTFSGNDLNEEWSKWRNTNADNISSGDTRKINAAVAEFVYANPSAPLSTLLLLTSFSRRDDETLFRRLWTKLTGDARDTKWVEMAGRADQPTMESPVPGKLISMALRSADNGVDTLRADSAEASLLFFWGSGITRRKEYVDSLKSLAEEFPDSASRIIADVCIEPDSIAWRSPLKSDSLTKVNRLWAPAGLADSRLIMLQVTRAPFFIVFSKDGNQRYRGSEISEAVATFRKLLKK